jgi:hypothetical protein
MNPCTVYRALFRGWDACYLENAFVRLVAVPDIGGRIMAYDLGPHPFIFVEDELAGKLFSPEENQGDGSLGAWKNYGGDKTWPAPQGWDNGQQWPGPPDPVLDSGRYTLDRLAVEGDCAVVSMTSPPDPRTGVQITRQATLSPDSSRVRLDLTFTNHTRRSIRWSIWDVIQLRADRRRPDSTLTHEAACTVTTPLNPHSVFPHGYNVLFGEEDNPQWQADPASGLFKAAYQWRIGKAVIDSPAGWIAFNNAAEGYTFAEQFTYQPGAEYPDGGATVEVWTVGAGQVGNFDYEKNPPYLMESEVLSPLYTIAPGAVASFALDWGACRCPGPVIDVSAAGCLSAPLHIRRLDDDYAQVTASGGVFEQGILRLLWLDAQQRILSDQLIGPADPLTLIHLDQMMKVPAHAAAAALSLNVHNRSLNLASVSL